VGSITILLGGAAGSSWAGSMGCGLGALLGMSQDHSVVINQVVMVVIGSAGV